MKAAQNSDPLSDTKPETLKKIADYIKNTLNQPIENVFHNETHKFTFKSITDPFTATCCGCLYDTLLIAINRASDNTVPEQFATSAFTNWIITAAFYGLGPYIHEDFQKHRLFRNTTAATQSTHLPLNERLDQLNRSCRLLTEFLANKQIPFNESMEFVLLQYLAACYTLIYHTQPTLTVGTANACSCPAPTTDYESGLDQVYNCRSHLYFKYLLLLKGVKEQPIEIQNLLHNDLMKRLVAPNGFAILCRNLLPIQNDGVTAVPLWKRAEIVYRIVGHRGHSPQFTQTLVDEIYKFYAQCLRQSKTGDDHDYRLACVGSLSKIYANPLHRQQIDAQFVGRFDVLCQPRDLLAGCILMDDSELRHLITGNWTAFCAPSAIGLPTKCLIRYLPVLLRLCCEFGDRKSAIQCQVNCLIVQCLANRSREQLKTLIDVLVSEEYPSEMQTMHPRVHIKQLPSKLYSLQIGDAAFGSEYDAASIFLQVLKQSQHNVFIYNVFVHLLEGMGECMTSESSGNAELLADCGELEVNLTKRFKRKVTTMYLLSELINHKPFHSQFQENPQEIVAVLQTILQHKIDGIRRKPGGESKVIDDSSMVIVMLLIIREILPKLKVSEPLVRTLKELDACCDNVDLKQEIDMIFQLVADGAVAKGQNSKSEYQLARRLCEERQPHLVVCGLMKFVKLIRNDRDAETLACKHAVLAIAVHCLQNEESYVFLNCIKLLIVLVDVLEVAVIDYVVAEYQTEDNLMDFRLKIGEVIVKVTEGLGE